MIDFIEVRVVNSTEYADRFQYPFRIKQMGVVSDTHYLSQAICLQAAKKMLTRLRSPLRETAE